MSPPQKYKKVAIGSNQYTDERGSLFIRRQHKNVGSLAGTRFQAALSGRPPGSVAVRVGVGGDGGGRDH